MSESEVAQCPENFRRGSRPGLDIGGGRERELGGIDGQPVGPHGHAAATGGCDDQKEVPAPGRIGDECRDGSANSDPRCAFPDPP